MIVSKWKSYFAKMARIRSKLMTGLMAINKKMNFKDFENKLALLKSNNKKATNFAEILADVPHADYAINDLKMFLHYFKSNFAKFKSERKSCLETMKKARVYYLLTACSSNTESHYGSVQIFRCSNRDDD